jgi:mannose-6-phosphate isomerase-like protein (cupin superfamily)
MHRVAQSAFLDELGVFDATPRVHRDPISGDWKAGAIRATTGALSAAPRRRRLARIACFGPAETNASYVVEVGLFPSGTALPPHLHPNTDEVFYVGDGEATFQLGDRELQLGAGAFVFVPRGTTHAVRNSGDGPIRGLIVISPGDAEHEFVPV